MLSKCSSQVRKFISTLQVPQKCSCPSRFIKYPADKTWVDLGLVSIPQGISPEPAGSCSGGKFVLHCTDVNQRSCHLAGGVIPSWILGPGGHGTESLTIRVKKYLQEGSKQNQRIEKKLIRCSGIYAVSSQLSLGFPSMRFALFLSFSHFTVITHLIFTQFWYQLLGNIHIDGC